MPADKRREATFIFSGVLDSRQYKFPILSLHEYQREKNSEAARMGIGNGARLLVPHLRECAGFGAATHANGNSLFGR